MNDTAGVEMVKAGYGDSFAEWGQMTRCLDFKVGFESLEAAAAAAEVIGGYNDYEGTLVAETLRKLAPVVGDNRVTVYVGRAGSPLIEIHSYAGVDFERIQSVMAEGRPDENTIEDSGYRRYVRCWWD